MQGPHCATFARYLIVAMVALGGCRADDALRRDLEIQVSPDLLRFDPQFEYVRISYTMRNAAEGELTLVATEVQAELTPESWTTLVNVNAGYIQDVLGETLPRGYAGERAIFFQRLSPGRYRLRIRFRPSGGTAVTSPAPMLDAMSNTLTVVP